MYAYTKADALDFIRDNDVKFIRLAFCDVWGNQKNVSVMPSSLDRAFESGISFDASAIDGFSDVSDSDLFLFPDPSTMSLLPWRPSHGRVVRFFCDIRRADGSPFPLDCRALLRRAVSDARDAGVVCTFGSECEFYLFKNDEQGNPTDIPLDAGGYMDVSPADRGENVRREICLTLEEMGILPEASHHECGPGQNEIDFHFSDPLGAADDVTTFKWVVRTVADRSGLHADFSPKPIPDRDGSGFHINIAPARVGSDPTVRPVCDDALRDAFIAGILAHIREITAFLNPSVQSYRRLGSFKAPKYAAWSPSNRSGLIRIPAAGGEYRRIELRSPDVLANPYAAFALLIWCGLDGLERRLSLPEPKNLNLYSADPSELAGLEPLPAGLAEAAALAGNSEFVRKHLPDGVVSAYTRR